MAETTRIREAVGVGGTNGGTAAVDPRAMDASALVALLIGGEGHATRAVASTVVAGHDGLRALAAADPAELERIPGLGRRRAARLAAAFELGRRAAAETPPRRWSVRAPRDIAAVLLPEMGALEREELRVLLLNAKNVVLRQATVYQGNVSAAVVRVGELFRDAVRIHAAGLVLVHNHPSGDPEPSADDLHLTAEAAAAGRLLDIAVLDHLVLAHGAFVSLRDRGVPFDRGSTGR